MMKIECQDCSFVTNDEADAERHQRETDHCMADPVEENDSLYDPDHWNPAEGGNRASNDYW